MNAIRWTFAVLISAASLSAAEATPRDLSAEFAVPEQQVRRIHEQAGLSYEEIRTALILSRETDRSLDDLVALRKAGVSFEAIAERDRLELDQVLADYDRERKARQEGGPRMAPRSVPESEPPVVPEGERPAVPESEPQLSPEPPARQPEPELEPQPLTEEEERALEAAEDRPFWDSPANPMGRERWDQQYDWDFNRRETGLPREQLDGRKERPQR